MARGGDEQQAQSGNTIGARSPALAAFDPSLRLLGKYVHVDNSIHHNNGSRGDNIVCLTFCYESFRIAKY